MEDQLPTQITRPSDLAGKTIERYDAAYAGRGVFLVFEDGSYAYLEVYSGLEEARLATDTPSLLELQSVGLISEDLRDRIHAEREEKREEDRKESRRRQYEELKEEFE